MSATPSDTLTRLDEPKRREASVSNPKPHTHMAYTISPNAQQAISRLRKLSDYTLNHYLDWVCMRRESCREEALRVGAHPDDRLKSLSMMMDYETLYSHAWMEAERRMHTPCMTCGDEGHVESEDYPHSQVVECPTCS